MNQISLNELQALTRHGIGLVVGPELTGNPGHEENLAQSIRALTSANKESTSHFLQVADYVFDNEKVPNDVLREIVKKHFESPGSYSSSIFRLLPANLRAVISLSFDTHFKEKYLQYIESKPIGCQLATVASPSDRPPARAMPYYALLGDLADSSEERRLVVSQSDYIVRKASWGKILRGLPDTMLGDPLFFIGHHSTVERLSDFISALLTLGHKAPQRLIFLSDDPILKDSTIVRTLETNFSPCVLDASIDDVGEAFSRSTLSVKTLPLWSLQSGNFFSPDLLSRVDDRLSYVPREEELNPNPSERNRLIDSLFRPTHLDWAPYRLNLPFKRDAHGEICAKISDLEKNQVVRFGGKAGIGKTVMLRQAAFELAQAGMVCFWVRRFIESTSAGNWESLVREFNSGITSKKTVVCFFWMIQLERGWMRLYYSKLSSRQSFNGSWLFATEQANKLLHRDFVSILNFLQNSQQPN